MIKKELSIEEKAKRYDEAIKTAIKINSGEGVAAPSDWTICEVIFPELKESEGEIIRSFLIDFIKACSWTEKKDQGWPLREECIAWLEKKDKQNPAEEIEPTPIFRIGDVLKRKDKDYTFRVDRIQGGYYHCDRNHGAFFPIEEQDNYELVEQKIDDKVEPKFKVGDWVVIDGEVLYITEVTREGYLTKDRGFIPFRYEKEVRLWDIIKDARDGDVLCDYCEAYDNPLIFILKKFEHVDFGLVRPSDYSSYCFLTAGDRQMFKEGTYHHEHYIQPATKEQRDKLEKAMANAGYEFDFDKLELKKIIDEKQIKKNLQDNSFRRMFEQKSTWSEEDEKLINRIEGWLDTLCDYLKDSSSECVADVKDIIGRLKSLRPQNRWKPSDAQMASITCAVRKMKESACYDSELVSLFNDLKKLKE